MSAPSHPDLRHFVRVYDDALPVTWCTRMLAGFDALSSHHARNGRGVRTALPDSAWTELNITRHGDPLTVGYFRKLMDEGLARYNAQLGLSLPVPPPSAWAELVLKRYRPSADERFQLHFDSVDHLANRYLVFLWYLNDVERGGGTRFPDLGLEVAARAGRLLVFPPYWMFQHEGLPPESGDKYILSTYLLFTSGRS